MSVCLALELGDHDKCRAFSLILNVDGTCVIRHLPDTGRHRLDDEH